MLLNLLRENVQGLPVESITARKLDDYDCCDDEQDEQHRQSCNQGNSYPIGQKLRPRKEFGELFREALLKPTHCFTRGSA